MNKKIEKRSWKDFSEKTTLNWENYEEDSIGNSPMDPGKVCHQVRPKSTAAPYSD